MSRKVGKVKLNTRSKGGRARKDKDIWEEFSVLGAENSIAYREELNLPAILAHPTAQAIFASVENQKVSTLLNSGEITRTVTEFKADGAAGKHDARWIAEAMVASERRAAGDYDEFLRAQFLRDWGDEVGEMLSDSDEQKFTEKKDKKLVAKSSILTVNTHSSPARNAGGIGGIGGYDGASSPKGIQKQSARAGDSSPFSELSELGSSPSGSFFNEPPLSPVPEDNANSIESTSNYLQSTEIHDERVIPDSEQDISTSASPAPIVSDLTNPQEFFD